MDKGRYMYHATSKDMEVIRSPKKMRSGGYYIEYNPNIGMFRLNCSEGVPSDMMGYETSKELVVSKFYRGMRR